MAAKLKNNELFLSLYNKLDDLLRNKYKKRSDGGLQFTKGKKTINDVPSVLRPQVEAMLKEIGA